MDNIEEGKHTNSFSKIVEGDQDNDSDFETCLSEMKGKTTDFIQKNPFISIAIAAGIGYIIAKKISGRRL